MPLWSLVTMVLKRYVRVKGLITGSTVKTRSAAMAYCTPMNHSEKKMNHCTPGCNYFCLFFSSKFSSSRAFQCKTCQRWPLLQFIKRESCCSPKCGDSFSFVTYIDESLEHLSLSVDSHGASMLMRKCFLMSCSFTKQQVTSEGHIGTQLKDFAKYMYMYFSFCVLHC